MKITTFEDKFDFLVKKLIDSHALTNEEFNTAFDRLLKSPSISDYQELIDSIKEEGFYADTDLGEDLIKLIDELRKNPDSQEYKNLEIDLGNKLYDQVTSTSENFCSEGDESSPVNFSKTVGLFKYVGKNYAGSSIDLDLTRAFDYNTLCMLKELNGYNIYKCVLNDDNGRMNVAIYIYMKSGFPMDIFMNLYGEVFAYVQDSKETFPRDEALLLNSVNRYVEEHVYSNKRILAIELRGIIQTYSKGLIRDNYLVSKFFSTPTEDTIPAGNILDQYDTGDPILDEAIASDPTSLASTEMKGKGKILFYLSELMINSHPFIFLVFRDIDESIFKIINKSTTIEISTKSAEDPEVIARFIAGWLEVNYSPESNATDLSDCCLSLINQLQGFGKASLISLT